MKNFRQIKLTFFLPGGVLLLSLTGTSLCTKEKSRQESLTDVKVNTADKKIRITNGQIELRFSNETGRRLSFLDAKDGEVLLDSGNYLAPVVLTVGGPTTIIRRQQQVWSILDVEYVGTAIKMVNWRKQHRGYHLVRTSNDPGELEHLAGLWICFRE